MSTLAGPLEYNAPPQSFIDSIPDLSHPAKTLIWYGLARSTRQSYEATINSYVLFCADRQAQPWPASEWTLIEWTTLQLYGSRAPKQRQINPNTAQSYLSAIKSYHIDRNLPTHAFASPRLNCLLKGARNQIPAFQTRTSSHHKRYFGKDHIKSPNLN